MTDLFDSIEGVCTAASGADFSGDSMYRYALWRVWNPEHEGGNVAVVGNNPSDANEWQDDMTITKTTEFTKRWGHGGFYMLNPWAYIAKNVLDMLAVDDAVGPRNDEAIVEYLANCNIKRVVVAWGCTVPVKWRAKLGWQSRIDRVLNLINRPVYCLGRTTGGEPRHPSRLAYDTPLELYWSPS